MISLSRSETQFSPERIHQRRWWTLSVLCLSLVIISIGNSSLNVALPDLAKQFSATNSQLQWVVAAYSLVFAGLLFTAGAIGDRFGRKGAMQVGLVIFLVGATCAAFSNQIGEIIAFRALMGAGAALVMPSTLSILVNVFPADERPRAIAIWAGVTGGAGAVGPVASGWLLGHAWFGSVFLINSPVILLALVAGHFLVPTSKDPAQGKLDPVGAVLSIIGISSLVYGLIQAPDRGWTSPSILAVFAVTVLVMSLFVAWELHTDEPMLDMHFFKNPAFSTSTGGMILLFMAMYGVMFLITQYFQLVLGYSALSASLRFLPIAPLMILIAPRTPWIAARIGSNRTVSIGMALVATAMIGFRALSLDTGYAYIFGCLVLLVVGISMAMSPMTSAIMSAVPPNRAGAGSAMNDATRELGSALGVAVLGSIAASHYTSALTGFVRDLPSAAQRVSDQSLAGALGIASKLPGQAGAHLTSGADQAFLGGIHLAVTVGAALALISSILTYRYLPSQVSHQGAAHGATESVEDSAELGSADTPAVFAD